MNEESLVEPVVLEPVADPALEAARQPARPAVNRGLQLLAVDDDRFTNSMVVGSLRAAGYQAIGVGTVREALQLLRRGSFHAVISDLDLGPGPSGADLLWAVHRESPWIGLIALTSHSSPELALGPTAKLPDPTVYLVKSQINGLGVLTGAVNDALRGEVPEVSAEIRAQRTVVTAAQGEVLRLMAAGASTAAIAASRGTTVRATEMMIHRLYEKLGLEVGSDRDPRTGAVLMWLNGQVQLEAGRLVG